MKILRIDRENPDSEMIELSAQIMRRGGIVVHATDTCYGMACDIHNEEAVRRLYQLKQMAFDKPISIIVADDMMMKCYLYVNDRVEFLVRKHWPGALTIVAEKGSQVPNFYNPAHKTVGARRPNCATSISLVRALGRPITTTSANLTKMPQAYNLRDIITQFSTGEFQPDLILDAGELPERPASTIVEISGHNLNVIRQGEVNL